MKEKMKSHAQKLSWLKRLGMLAAVLFCLYGMGFQAKAGDIRIQCGDNCYGVLSDTGVLTIKGTGDMWDFDGNGYNATDSVISNKCRYDAYKVIIENGITSIGDYAFFKLERLQEVSIGNSVNKIGEYAFYNTKGLFSIDIPSNVKIIKESAFCHSALYNVSFHEGLQIIGNSAFNSTGISNLSLPNGLSSIESYAFAHCPLEKVFVPEHVTIIKSDAFYAWGRSGMNVIFESMDVMIGANAFGKDDTFQVERGSTAETYARNYGLSISYIQHPYVLTLDSCTGNVDSRIVFSDTSIGTLRNLTRKGYLFLGWYNARSGGIKYGATNWMPAGNLTLYAHWQKVTVPTCSRPAVANFATRKAFISLKKVKGAKGYEYAWSLKKNMKSAKHKYTAKSYLTISNLKKNRVYYIRVRAYRLDSTKRRVYGKWSGVRAIRIRK